MSPVPLAVVAALLLAASGCAGRKPRADVDAGVILPPMAGNVKVPEDQQFLFPSPIGPNALPVYPAALVSRGLPEQVVCLRLVIDDGGAVASSAHWPEGPDCGDDAQAPFVEAARQAVATWEFLAATV